MVHVLAVVLAGWLNRHQQLAIEYLREENRVLREMLGTRRLRFTDAQRPRLAIPGRELGRRLPAGIATLVTPVRRSAPPERHICAGDCGTICGRQGAAGASTS